MELSGVKLLSPNEEQMFNLINDSRFYPNSHIHFVAVSTLNEANRNSRLKSILNEGVSIIDSKPISICLSMIGEKCSNLRGSDFFRFAIRTEKGANGHFLIGSSPETLKLIFDNSKTMNPNFEIKGSISPEIMESFESSYPDWQRQIEASGANLVWIGLGSPKQDVVAADLSLRYGFKTFAVGAAFDFLGGTKKEAPLILQKFSLEWLFRLISEPKRLWRRYLIGNAKFIVLVALEIFRRIRKKDS